MVKSANAWLGAAPTKPPSVSSSPASTDTEAPPPFRSAPRRARSCSSSARRARITTLSLSQPCPVLSAYFTAASASAAPA